MNQQLTPDQKEHYKQRAKAQPTIVKHVPAKYTSQGVPLDLVEREARELVEKQKYMERKVHSVVEDSFLENSKQSPHTHAHIYNRLSSIEMSN